MEIQSIPGYVAEFKKAFGSDKVEIEKVTRAIAAFEEALATPNSRFDRWLKGDAKALSADELVDVMGRLQLGKKFTGAENAKIVAFLKTLTGDQPDFKLPLLPPSSDGTPRPQPFDQ